MKVNSNKNKKVKKLIVICSICAVTLIVSTYAWFIGMKTVSVSSFDVDIATTEGLFLSMDGENWSYNLDARHATAYDDNTNYWAPTGLIPVSTVGDMDPDVSRMKLFEKGSIATTTGGFRLLASRVHNYDETDGVLNQGKGYVVFDLFVKNLSGTEYYDTNEPLNEEDIYLTTDSAVTVAQNGGVSGTGIENSVRVAFTQIGRVAGTTESQDNITAITCDDVEASDGQVQVTGICRDAQIWEPNDKGHVQNAINWYSKSCLPRVTDGDTVTDPDSYDADGTCTAVALDTAYPTYSISRPLLIADNVDIYDGLSYNTYLANSTDYATYTAAEDKSNYKLVSFPYFTDSKKILRGTARPTFMTLAPNSITKLRVYIYIEGQDIDNYDFASLGAKISIKFGFTKERYIEEDLPYTGPSTNITPTAEEEAAANAEEETEEVQTP